MVATATTTSSAQKIIKLPDYITKENITKNQDGTYNIFDSKKGVNVTAARNAGQIKILGVAKVQNQSTAALSNIVGTPAQVKSEMPVVQAATNTTTPKLIFTPNTRLLISDQAGNIYDSNTGEIVDPLNPGVVKGGGTFSLENADPSVTGGISGQTKTGDNTYHLTLDKSGEKLKDYGVDVTVDASGNIVSQKWGIQQYANETQTLASVLPVALAGLNFVVPGISSALGSALGASGSLAPIVGGAAIGAGTSALTGGNIFTGALTGAIGGSTQALTGALTPTFGDSSSMLSKAITSGTNAAIKGGNIEGAVLNSLVPSNITGNADFDKLLGSVVKTGISMATAPDIVRPQPVQQQKTVTPSNVNILPLLKGGLNVA